VGILKICGNTSGTIGGWKKPRGVYISWFVFRAIFSGVETFPIRGAKKYIQVGKNTCAGGEKSPRSRGEKGNTREQRVPQKGHPGDPKKRRGGGKNTDEGELQRTNPGVP